ncbi:MAG TPA: SGNH/GDSL hydrolase family protein [Rhodocyclaceae bacterium]|nr:SGNH/GDSL hydrolase family protein [Rhodocyclaceae bacterium]
MRRSMICIIASSMLMASLSAGATSFTANYVFGDSLSDVGNDYLVTGGQVPFAGGYNNGRFSNGNNYVDYLDASLGLAAPTPSVSGGTDYAYGGARTSSNALSDLNAAFNTLNFNNEIATFAAAHPAADPAALYTVFMGANDVFAALTMSAPDAQTYLQQSIYDIGTGVDTLVALGARNILLPNVPDLGLTPRIDASSKTAVSAVTAQFNAGVALSIDAIAAANPDVHFYRFDTYAALDDVVNNPSAFGMANATTSCFSGTITSPFGTTCSTPDTYVFWDDIHPTTAMDKVLANEMVASIASVPEPSAWLMLLAGLSVLMVLYSRTDVRLGKNCFYAIGIF